MLACGLKWKEVFDGLGGKLLHKADTPLYQNTIMTP